jgi:hypothetical protein
MNESLEILDSGTSQTPRQYATLAAVALVAAGTGFAAYPVLISPPTGTSAAPGAGAVERLAGTPTTTQRPAGQSSAPASTYTYRDGNRVCEVTVAGGLSVVPACFGSDAAMQRWLDDPPAKTEKTDSTDSPDSTGSTGDARRNRQDRRTTDPAKP